jgi:mannosyl-3-phosphoglycerate phosphatase
MRRWAGSWVVFTDLDGTLLDHTTYRWDAAQGTLDALRCFRVPLVIVTSKTLSEVQPLLRKLGRREPVVVENGGAIHFPVGYFPFRIKGAVKSRKGGLHVALGTPRPRVLRALAQASQRAGVRVRSFAEMSARELAERAGFSLADARRALQREFDEPFVILDADRNAPARLKRQIQCLGMTMTRGSRFFHILGGNDKGEAVWRLTAWFYRAFGQSVCTVGLGGSPNDIPLLRAVDVPILVARPNGRYDPETLAAVPRAQRASGAGPAGWNSALLSLLLRPGLPTE